VWSKNEKPHARGESGSSVASQVRRSLPDNRERLPKSCYEKRTLPDARREIDRQTDYSRQEYEGEEKAICRSQKIAGRIKGYASQFVAG